MANIPSQVALDEKGLEPFTNLREANIARQAAWCPEQIPDLSFRGCELAGEVGEALNVIKKLERERLGWRGSRDTVEHLAEEIADVVICADLVALSAGIDLEAAVVAKFNATSEKVGLPHRLAFRTLSLSNEAGDDGQGALVERQIAAMDFPEHKRDDPAFLRACLMHGKRAVDALTRENATLRAGNERLERELKKLDALFKAQVAWEGNLAERRLAEQGQAQGEAGRFAERVVAACRAYMNTYDVLADEVREHMQVCMADALRAADAIATPPSPEPDWKKAFAAQSRKLQAVLDIPGVKAALDELKGADGAPSPEPDALHEFKNFHRNLCERFDYCHDEKDWRRDQVSLIEHIARKVSPEPDAGLVGLSVALEICDHAKLHYQGPIHMKIRREIAARIARHRKQGGGVMATFEFDRYINGVLMAEGVTIERQPNLECAMRVAAHIASRGPNGEAPVLVLRTPQPAAQPGVVKEAVRRELADVEASLDDAISYLVDLAGAKPTPMSPQNCRIHIDHARMSARNLAALAAPVSQEPVAWGIGSRKFTAMRRVAEIWEEQGNVVTPLYASPQPPTEGEPNEAEVERVAEALDDLHQQLVDCSMGDEFARKFARAALLAAKSKGGQADG